MRKLQRELEKKETSLRAEAKDKAKQPEPEAHQDAGAAGGAKKDWDGRRPALFHDRTKTFKKVIRSKDDRR